MCRIDHEGQVLIVETAYRRGWGFPGGLVDRHERPDVGVVREVREEVGIEVELVGDPIVVVDTALRTVDFLYRGRLAPGVCRGDARPASYEIAQVEWVPDADVIARVEAVSRDAARRLRLYDQHPAGALVYVDRALREVRRPSDPLVPRDGR